MPNPRRAWSRAVVLASLLAIATTSVATASEFPAGYEGYHSYTEVAADVAAVAAAHPSIVSRFSIGKSYQGRDIWAVKVSDNVATDEAEAEVMFDGSHHANEHMATEMTLRILHWLVDGYGTDPRITKIVDSREIWIVFVVNPDGVEFDISGGRFHSWRKNRQPNAGTTSVGTDLNRNYGYKWGGGGATSASPSNRMYRGSAPFSTPEARAMRDFLASRVVDGRQQIRAAITFHENGRLVMWPYGYTTRNVPSDMTIQDYTAFVKIGRHMASTNGYTPQQASDLYVSSGSSRDYMYGTYRMFVFTFEMSIQDFPDDARIGPETGRNKAAVLYLMERAWCPLGAVSAAVRIARCGAFDDDLEVGRGWRVNPDGTDTAPFGAGFVRANPSQTTSNGPKQLGTTRSGVRAFVTGARAGASAGANDLDGRTSVRSPRIVLPSTLGQRLTFGYVFAHGRASTSADTLRAIVEKADGTQVEVWRRVGRAADVDGVWRTASIGLDAFAGQTIRLRFEARDGSPGNLLEVELDDIRVTLPS